MATNIRRSLYVGLGGTGMGTLLKVKKQFIDTYGELPPMIGFLGIDTDGGAYNETIELRNGTMVKLDPNEQLPLTIQNPRAIYERNTEHMAWLHERNIDALDGLKNIGAGQIRSNGRFVLKYCYRDVARKIKAVVDQISAAEIRHNDKYNILATNTLDVHLIFSVCGGTGAGTFIDAAYMIREAIGDCKLTGYAVLPDVFEAMSSSGMAKVKPNAFGAIQDLDYLMHLNATKDKIEFDWLTSSMLTNERPFNAFFFIDNKNTNNDTFNDISRLSDMIALALVTSAGELSVASASVSDNIEKSIMEGDMDIKDKKAWVSAMGVCEILFRASDLSKIYSMKAAKVIIERLKQSCADIDTMVNAWIDSPEINIRENNGKDNVIDALLPKSHKFPFSAINDKSNPKPEVDGYLATAIGDSDAITDATNALCAKISDALENKITELMNQECGIDNAKNFLSALEVQLDIFLGEMRSELARFKENNQPNLKNALNTSIADLKEHSGRFLRNSRRNEEYCETVINTTNALATCEREIKRRDAAITFFTGLKQKLTEVRLMVHNVENALDTVYQNLTKQMAGLQNNVNNTIQDFNIDLTEKKMQSVSVDPKSINFGDFIKYLTGIGLQVSNFEKIETKKLESIIIDFTRKKLPDTSKWGNMSIEDVLNEMSPEELNKTIRESFVKSMPMLQFDAKGYTVNEQPGDFFYIGVYDKANTRLAKDNLFKNQVQGDGNVFFSSIGHKERIIIFRQVGVVPAFEIAPLFNYREKYESCKTFCHFDAKVHLRMQREEYSLMPANAADDTLELWVKGILIGKIKNENGKYYIHSTSLGDPLDNYWYLLGEYRDDAFSHFRSSRNTLGVEIEKAIDDYETKMGSENVAKLISDVKEEGNYLAKYSQLGLSTDDLKKKGYEGIRKQVSDEIDYVTKSL